MVFKISKKYWEGLSQIEKDFFIERAEKSGVSACKEIVSAAKKKLPGYTKIYGNGKVMKGGIEYNYTGSDTRTFWYVENDKMIFLK